MHWEIEEKVFFFFFLSETLVDLVMEKSKSFPEYSCSYTEFGFSERSNSYNFNGPNQKGNGFSASSDPEIKRKKRIKAYNVLTVEGKLKTNVRNSFKWIKNKFSDIRYGVWTRINHKSCLPWG